jgi:gamma-glutamyl phosphate reductase
MGDVAEQFRKRAQHLAAAARDEHSRNTLTEIAVELDEEANKIDAENQKGFSL